MQRENSPIGSYASKQKDLSKLKIEEDVEHRTCRFPTFDTDRVLTCKENSKSRNAYLDKEQQVKRPKTYYPITKEK